MNHQKLRNLINVFEQDEEIYSLKFTRQRDDYLLNDSYESIYSVYYFPDYYSYYKKHTGERIKFKSEKELLTNAGISKKKILDWKTRFEDLDLTGIHQELDSVYFIYIRPEYGLIYISPENEELIQLQEEGKTWMIFEEVHHIRDNWFFFFADR